MNQRPLLPLALACLSAFATLGCVMMRPPPRGPVDPSAQPEPEPTPAAEPTRPSPGRGSAINGHNPGRATSTPPAPTKMIPTTVEVRSECGKTVPVFFGDGKPGFSSGRKSSISSNSISSEGRNPDGTLTIWIIDEHENGLTNVKITPDTQHVTLNRDCASFSAN